MLNSTYFKIAKLSTEKTEAEESLEDVLEVCTNCYKITKLERDLTLTGRFVFVGFIKRESVPINSLP